MTTVGADTTVPSRSPADTTATKAARVSLVINTACADSVTAANRNPFRSATYLEHARTYSRPRYSRAARGSTRSLWPAPCRRTWSKPFPPSALSAFLPFVTTDGTLYCSARPVLVSRLGASSYFATTTMHLVKASPNTSGVFPGVDILVPRRVHLKTKASLNNGRDDDYMGGHLYAMRRWIWASLPLTSAPDEYWDVFLTPKWRELGARIAWTDDIVHYDCEATVAET